MKRLARKFDYVNNVVSNDYRDLADVDFFVDTKNGDDTNAGTSAAPFKTLGKVKSLGSGGGWVDGVTVMIAGIIDESISIDVDGVFIGVGGGKGGRVYSSGLLSIATSGFGSTFENFWFDSIGNVFCLSNSNNTITMYNCISYNMELRWFTVGRYPTINCNYCSFVGFKYSRSPGQGGDAAEIVGNNNTFWNRQSSTTTKVTGKNNYFNNTAGIQNFGLSNYIGTDDMELIDPDNYNFNIPSTSGLYKAGEFNPTKNDYDSIGSGREGQGYDYTSGVLLDSANGGTATRTNLQLNAVDNVIERINSSIDGVLESDYIDLTRNVTKIVVDFENTFLYSSGELYRLIQETGPELLDYYIKYGDSTAEVDSCPRLLTNQGTILSISGTGGSRVGNADSSYDDTSYTDVEARYIKIKLKFKTIT